MRDEREAKAQEIFTRFCDGAGLAATSAPAPANAAAPSAEWHVETGEEPRWMATYGVAADLIVAPRGGRRRGAGASSTLEAALLESGRPILIPAAAAMPASFERIAIAWKPTPQAARAVAAGDAVPRPRQGDRRHHRGGRGRGAARGQRRRRSAGAKPRLAWNCGDQPRAEAGARGCRRDAAGRRSGVGRISWSWAAMATAGSGNGCSVGSPSWCWPRPRYRC